MLEVSLSENPPDVVITEIGGTVGRHRESALPGGCTPASRRSRPGENVLYIHVTLVPYISAAGELKTKPTQHSVKELTGLGIQPGHHRLPQRKADSPRCARKDRPLLQHARRVRV